jgi:hypothetical protein
MLTCPLCKKTLRALVRECPSCRTDLTLLADFVSFLQQGLNRAETLTRAGELGEATWGYLAVLEVDPENEQARRQVGLVATAVRQFDRTSPSRRRLQLPGSPASWRAWAAGLALLVAGLGIGFAIGRLAGPFSPAVEDTAPLEKRL